MNPDIRKRISFDDLGRMYCWDISNAKLTTIEKYNGITVISLGEVELTITESLESFRRELIKTKRKIEGLENAISKIEFT